MIKIQFNYYSEFYDANLQQSSLQFTLQSQVSIMVSVMTLRDLFTTSVLRLIVLGLYKFSSFN